MEIVVIAKAELLSGEINVT